MSWLGQLVTAVTVLVLLSVNVWVWLEPRNYVIASRTRRLYEAYIRSIDQYYKPFEVSLRRIQREHRQSANR